MPPIYRQVRHRRGWPREVSQRRKDKDREGENDDDDDDYDVNDDDESFASKVTFMQSSYPYALILLPW